MMEMLHKKTDLTPEGRDTPASWLRIAQKNHISIDGCKLKITHKAITKVLTKLCL